MCLVDNATHSSVQWTVFLFLQEVCIPQKYTLLIFSLIGKKNLITFIYVIFNAINI